MRQLFTLTILALVLPLISYGQFTLQGTITDKNSGDGVMANVYIEHTNIGTLSAINGTFSLDAPSDSAVLVVSAIGYKDQKTLITRANYSDNVSFMLEEDVYGLDEVVITGSRTSRKRTESQVIVDVLDSKTIENTNSLTLSDGLKYQPGIRVETDCQTCNYTQLRINGLGGNYSQVLMNSRPVFSALNGLYGLEQIPANMIERVEVVRGGGSAVYGANAIAGTVNIITKEPKENIFGITYNHLVLDQQSTDKQVNLNASIVNEAGNAGVSIFGVHKSLEAYDANGDGFSEIPRIYNNSLGIKLFNRFENTSKLTIDFHTINEERQGGDSVYNAPHKTSQSEFRDHKIVGGGINYEYALNNRTDFSIYTSGQLTDRQHYTGLDGVDAYGLTENTTMVAGSQFNHTMPGFIGSVFNTLTLGGEYVFDQVTDDIPLYNHHLDQITHQLGIYAQSDWQVTPKFSSLIGVRMDNHNLLNAPVINPRLSLLYQTTDNLQFRGSISTGFRAPQAFDADLHIAFAAGGISKIVIDPNLTKETSLSYSASVNFDKPMERKIYGFTIDAFYTRLFNAFVLEEDGVDAQGNMILMRRNSSGSNVYGVSVEGRANFNKKLQLEGGITFQKSVYVDPVAWSADIEGSKNYMRTPNRYGFYTLTIQPDTQWKAVLSGVYTGPMLVPHIGGAPGVDGDRVITTQNYLEQNIRLSYKWHIHKFEQDVELFGGVQNMLNHYQQDFDIGKDRDSNYVYGPARPRTIFIGIKLEI